MPRRVAITANTSWYLYNFRRNTIVTLIDEGFDVYAISPADNYSDKLKSLGCNWSDVYIDRVGINPARDLLTFFNFFYIYFRVRPNCVLNFTPKNNIYSSLACMLLRIPYVNNIAGLGKVFVENGFLAGIVKALYKVSQSRVERIFFQNDEDRLLFLQSKIVPQRKAVRLFGSGVDLERFVPEFRQPDGCTRFLLVARLLRHKGVRLYARSAAVLKKKYGNSVQFRLIGPLDDGRDGISKAELDSWVDEGAINYLGVSDSIEDELRESDCVVLPSYYREGVPKSLLEALGAGKPIITTDNVGCRETVDHMSNGFICRPNDVESLTEALDMFMLLSTEDRKVMGRLSRQKAELVFDEKLIIDSYIEAVRLAIS